MKLKKLKVHKLEQREVPAMVTYQCSSGGYVMNSLGQCFASSSMANTGLGMGTMHAQAAIPGAVQEFCLTQEAPDIVAPNYEEFTQVFGLTVDPAEYDMACEHAELVSGGLAENPEVYWDVLATQTHVDPFLLAEEFEPAGGGESCSKPGNPPLDTGHPEMTMVSNGIEAKFTAHANVLVDMGLNSFNEGLLTNTMDNYACAKVTIAGDLAHPSGGFWGNFDHRDIDREIFIGGQTADQTIPEGDCWQKRVIVEAIDASLNPAEDFAWGSKNPYIINPA
mgnify:CR=1 FL=1